MSIDYPTNADDIIDSRDVIEALADLAKLHQAGPVELDGEIDGVPVSEYAQDDLFRLETVLTALAAEASDYAADWEYGEQLIRDSYFEEYAQQLADDLGSFSVRHEYDRKQDRDLSTEWPFTCIDWKQAARELQMDYTSVDFDGVTYWIR